MAYSDEWWKGKYGTGTGCPDNNPNLHSTCGYPIASHPDGYANEEWWGIMRTIDSSINPDIMEPRAAYYKLQSLWIPAPSISVFPTSHNFGNVNVGSLSAPQTFTISNIGTANLVIGTMTLTGTNASEFNKQNDNCSGQTVTPSSNCTVQVVFSPKSTGSKSAALSIPSNDPDTPTLNVPLYGTGVGFNYSLSNSGPITVTQGSSGSNTINATLTSGTTQSVSFSASGLPSGATASFSPGSCSPTCSSTLTISTSAYTPTGTYPITVTGSPLSKTTQFSLIAGFEASGRVTTSAGTGISGVTMTFSRVSGTGTIPASVQTDTNGNWSQSGFQNGTTYRVTPSKISLSSYPSKSGYIFTPPHRDFNSQRSDLHFMGMEIMLLSVPK